MKESKDERLIVQNYLKKLAEGSTPVNADQELASQIFAGAMIYASNVFINHLVIGGAYCNTKDCQEIANHLKAICKTFG